VYTCTCTVHDKLSCTRLQNYTIGAALKSVSVAVSVLWNLSSTRLTRLVTIENFHKHARDSMRDKLKVCVFLFINKLDYRNDQRIAIVEPVSVQAS